jgi:mono/diheme cytochrome c family protein
VSKRDDGSFTYIHNMASSMLLTTILSGLLSFSAYAGAGDHDKQEPHSDSADMHRHDKWLTPPDAYQNKAINNWDDREAAKKGNKLYEQYCLQCHGTDGKGTGPLASSLEHAPADLTNHFHQSAGNGDAYLYWRISEGGTVEPFVSMKSAMPSFKMILSEDDRWNVLIYVHQAFHKSFNSSKNDEMKNEHMGHQH